MKDKNIRIIYWVSTGLFTALMLMSAGMHFFNTEVIKETFTKLNFPTNIVIPYGIAKILGLVAIWTKKSDFLKGLAYAGYFYAFVLAFTANIFAMNNDIVSSFIALALTIISYFSEKKLYSKNQLK